MKEKKVDRRISRTRRLMHEALMALIVEKGYEAVTVQDILDRADVGRSTFYAHYRDKDELLLSSFDHLRTLFEEQQQALLASKRTGRDPAVNFVLELFRHTGKHHRLYKAIAGKQSGEMILKYLHRYLYNLLIGPHTEMMKESIASTVPVEITTHHLVSSLLSLLTWWLDNNMPYPPEKMDEFFRILSTPTLEAVFGRKMEEKIMSEYAAGSVMAFYSQFIDRGCCPDK
ncbi:TetR/AcrR family transcriptional regulator [Chlorobium sp. BLA1]|uniref:TetR/AcrR family transcriptional regulator n=1 Tax=Candidatus Chlorobium masyuteum TaxID=2716876 RepID=UPI00141E1035|nr:TetR/AcrR family transcriptional regulator [Candidatus Chlorobium masyuteum]NHQ60778.1 TetR/AcrR family transcriptional regulator [Candidatus Chlorobium masyuteum]